MRAVWWSILIPALGIVAGCAGTGTSWGNKANAPAAQPVQRCDTAGAQWAVGKTNTVKHVEDARRRSGALMARVIQQGQPVTADANVERLNLQVDATGRIIAASCG